MPEQHKPCPQCQKPMPVHQRFRTWCAECEWNLEPPTKEMGTGILARIVEALGEKHGRTLFQSLAETAEDDLRPRWNLSKSIAFAICVCVHLISPVLLCLVAILNYWTWPNLFSIIVGVALLMMVWLLRPRLGEIPEDRIDPRNFPTLFQMVNRICDRLGTKHVSMIVIDESFNAAFSQVGWRQQSVLWIGLPYWSILTPEERLALISHEISHSANGDPTRSLIVGHALDTLVGWFRFLRPEYVQPLEDRDLFEIIAQFFAWTLSCVVEFAVWILAILVWRNMQIAEYLADYLGTKISGTSAAICLLHKSSYGQYFEEVVLANVVDLRQSGREVIEIFETFVASLPEHEIERVRRVDRLVESRLDDTHPPTVFRIDFLNSHPQNEPAPILTPAECEALDGEMDSIKEAVGKKLINSFLAYR